MSLMTLDIGMEHQDMKRAFAAIFFDSFGQHRYRPICRCAVPMRAEDPRPPDVDVSALAVFLIPRLIIYPAFLVFRLKQIQQVPVRQRPQPTVIAVGVLLVVISFDGNYRNARLLHHLQSGDGVVHRFGRDAAFMKEIPANNNKIDLLADGIFL